MRRPPRACNRQFRPTTVTAEVASRARLFTKRRTHSNRVAATDIYSGCDDHEAVESTLMVRDWDERNPTCITGQETAGRVKITSLVVPKGPIS